MKKLDNLLYGLYLKYCSFRDSERGDTNFISMLLIIGIVVVLATAFLTLSNTVSDTIKNKVEAFINKI